MPDPIRLTVAFDPARLSANVRVHFHERARRGKVVREAARLAWIAAGRPTLPPPVRVDAIVHRARRLDTDNALSGLKAAFDGLFKGGIVADDGPAFVKLGDIQQETGKEFAGNRAHVEFIITSLSSEADEA